MHKEACLPTKGDVINDIKLFLKIYCRTCPKLLLVSNQALHYNSKCIRIFFFIIRATLTVNIDILRSNTASFLYDWFKI